MDVLLAPASWPASATRNAPVLDPAALAQEIHIQVNAVRTRHGLTPLAWKDRLAEVALAHSRDMADHAYFGHTNRRGEDAGDRARQAGLSDRARVGAYVVEGVGENLFMTHHFRAYEVFTQADGQQTYLFEWKTQQEIAQEAVARWMQSPAHRANLLSPLYHGEAIGVGHSANEVLFITQNFTCQSDDPLAAR